MDRLPEWLKKYVGAAEHAHWADCSSRDTYDWMYNAIRAFLNAAEKDGWQMAPGEATKTMLEAAIPYPEELVKEREAEAGNLHYRERMVAAVQAERLVLSRRYRDLLAAAKEEGK